MSRAVRQREKSIAGECNFISVDIGYVNPNVYISESFEKVIHELHSEAFKFNSDTTEFFPAGTSRHWIFWFKDYLKGSPFPAVHEDLKDYMKLHPSVGGYG
jgi:hypothetical protein